MRLQFHSIRKFRLIELGKRITITFQMISNKKQSNIIASSWFHHHIVLLFVFYCEYIHIKKNFSQAFNWLTLPYKLWHGLMSMTNQFWLDIKGELKSVNKLFIDSVSSTVKALNKNSYQSRLFSDWNILSHKLVKHPINVSHSLLLFYYKISTHSNAVTVIRHTTWFKLKLYYDDRYSNSIEA